MKTRIFIDYWNFQLSLNEYASQSYRLDWKKLSPLIIQKASDVVAAPLFFEETRVYMSYDLKKVNDRKLKNWALNTLDRFPGVHVTLKERKPKQAPFCQSCHQAITYCPHCGEALAGTIEKGVDTAIVTDLFSLAWEGAWQVAILVSSDRDFFPAVEMLSIKGFRIINANFPPLGIELARACWASLDLREFINDLERK